MRRDLLICAGLALLTLAVYSPVRTYDFVCYDDPWFITENPQIRNGLAAGSLTYAFTTAVVGNWHPVTTLSHLLDCQFFGTHPGPHHLVSLLFHVASVLLLFLALRQMTAAAWRSAIVAALFGLHPLHVESVAWVSERKDVLSGFFFMLTIWAYGRYAEVRSEKCEVRGLKSEIRNPKSETQGPKKGNESNSGIRIQNPESRIQQPNTLHARRFYALALLFFALGLMSKPMLVTLPFVLLLLDFWPLQRSNAPTLQRSNAFFLLLEKLPFFALSAISCAITLAVQKQSGSVQGLEQAGLGSRIANALVSYALYLGKTFWPTDLAVLYPLPPRWPLALVLFAALLVVSLTVVALRYGARLPFLASGWFWFVGMLVPVIGIVQVGSQSMADRYTYLPLIGIFIALTWAAAEAFSRWQVPRPAAVLAAGIVVGGCAMCAANQVRVWEDSGTLFRHTLAVTTDNYQAYYNLGCHLANQGKLEEAAVNYQRAIEIKPKFAAALENLGSCLVVRHQYAEAIPYFEAALNTKTDPVVVQGGLAGAWRFLGGTNEAHRRDQAASYHQATVHFKLANALARLKRTDEAIAHLRLAVQANPGYAEAYNNLGMALGMKGRLEEAVIQFREAVQRQPKNIVFQCNLGRSLGTMRRFDEAAAAYSEALRLAPNNPDVHNSFAVLLAGKGDFSQAALHFEEALRYRPNDPSTHLNLAKVLDAQTRFDEAIAQCDEALRLKPDFEPARQELQALRAKAGK